MSDFDPNSNDLPPLDFGNEPTALNGYVTPLEAPAVASIPVDGDVYRDNWDGQIDNTIVYQQPQAINIPLPDAPGDYQWPEIFQRTGNWLEKLLTGTDSGGSRVNPNPKIGERQIANSIPTRRNVNTPFTSYYQNAKDALGDSPVLFLGLAFGVILVLIVAVRGR